jgi:hypothetical protein
VNIDKNPLLRLPAELRNEIWELALESRTHTIRFKTGVHGIVAPSRPPALLQVCTAIRHETSPMRYANQTLDLELSANNRFYGRVSRDMRRGGLAGPLRYARKAHFWVWSFCAGGKRHHISSLDLDFKSGPDCIKRLWMSKCDECYIAKGDQRLKEAIIEILGEERRLSFGKVAGLCNKLRAGDASGLTWYH